MTPVACSRLRDSRARVRKREHEKINGRNRAPYTFACSPLFRPFPTIREPGTGYDTCKRLDFPVFSDRRPRLTTLHIDWDVKEATHYSKMWWE